MSLILQALQRARRDHSPEDPNHDSRVHRPQRMDAPPRRQRLGFLAWFVLATSFLTLALAAFAVWYAISRLSSPHLAAAGRAGMTPQTELPVVLPQQSAAMQQVAPPRMDDLPPPVPANMIPPTTAQPGTAAAQPRGVVIESADGSQPAPPLSDRVKDGFSLGTILYDQNMRIAVINGQMMHEGEDRGDFRVVEITANSVTIDRKNGSPPIVLRMAGPSAPQ